MNTTRNDVHFLAALPLCLPERQLVLFPCLSRGQLVRCGIENAALSLLWGRPVHTEAEQAEAFGACRVAVEGLVRQLLASGRGEGGGLSVTAEDVGEVAGVARGA